MSASCLLVLPTAVIVILGGASPSVAQSKVDILGITNGMTSAEVRAVVVERGWVCYCEESSSSGWNIQAGKGTLVKDGVPEFLLYVTLYIRPRRVWKINYFSQSKAEPKAIEASILDQFKPKERVGKDGDAEIYDLGNRLRLSFDLSDAKMMYIGIASQTVVSEDVEYRRKLEQQPPKF